MPFDDIVELAFDELLAYGRDMVYEDAPLQVVVFVLYDTGEVSFYHFVVFGKIFMESV